MKLQQLVGVVLLLSHGLIGARAQYIYGALSPAQRQQQQQQQQQHVEQSLEAHNFGRPQRSLYGQGWNTIGVSPLGLGHITKDDLITLLEAWKAAERPAAPEPEPEEDPEPESEEEPAPAQPAPPADAQPPPSGVPLTVSLPAFVPINLSAMYTAPPPPAPPAPAPAPEEPEDEAEPEPEEELAPPPPQKLPHPHPWSFAPQLYSRNVFGRQQPVAVVMRSAPRKTKAKTRARSKSSARSFKAGRTATNVQTPQDKPSTIFPNQNLRSFASTNYVAAKPRSYAPSLHYAGSSPRIYTAPPPPPFLGQPPAHLSLASPSQLLGNWH